MQFNSRARPAGMSGWRNTGQYYLVDHKRSAVPVRIYEFVDRNKYRPHTGKKQLAKAAKRTHWRDDLRAMLPQGGKLNITVYDDRNIDQLAADLAE